MQGAVPVIYGDAASLIHTLWRKNVQLQNIKDLNNILNGRATLTGEELENIAYIELRLPHLHRIMWLYLLNAFCSFFND